MSSGQRIENLSENPEDGEEEFVFPVIEEDEDCQQVDRLRVARLSRALARWAGALSENPHRVDDRA